MKPKWTYEACFEEARKYRTVGEFRTSARGAYLVACRNKWTMFYTWLEDTKDEARKWTYAACHAEARKYASRWEFSRHCPAAYEVARDKGWLDDYSWFQTVMRKWDRDTCREEARKYTSRAEFQEKNGSAYQMALKCGWMDDYTWLENTAFNLYSDKIVCVYAYEFEEQKAVYVGRTLMARKEQRHQEHLASSDVLVRFARKHGLPIPDMTVLEENLTVTQATAREGAIKAEYKEAGWKVINRAKAATTAAPQRRDRWTRKACLEEARKYQTKVDFEKGSAVAFSKAQTKGWMKDYTWMEEGHKPNNYWNYDRCYLEAKKYTTRTEFQKAPNNAYEVAREKGWLADYTWLVVRQHEPWTLETCREEASRYASRSAFCHGSKGAYDAARKHGWLDAFFPPKPAPTTQLGIDWEE